MIYSLLKFRFQLMKRQRLIWAHLGLSLGSVVLSFLFARISFVSPEKVFWDLSQGLIFILLLAFSLYWGCFLFQEEKQKRTLDWILTMRVSRWEWIVGNFWGILFSLSVVAAASWILSFALGLTLGGPFSWGLWLQSILFCEIEIAIVLALSFLFSFLMRPVISLSFIFILTLFLHAQDSLRQILTDPVSGRFVESYGLAFILYALKLFPPLHWFDLRIFLSFEGPLALIPFLGILVTGLIWCFVLLVTSKIVFERMDL